jgi:lantibiotic modifying enzyme
MLMRTESQSYLELAHGIASYVSRTAIWHEERCTWIGAMPQAGAGGRPTLTYQAFDADLYGGTAGVGLFLAEMAAVQEDDSLRTTALGALRHAHRRVQRIDGSVGDGLYSGAIGVACALARAGQVLNESRLLEEADEIGQSQLPERVQGERIECDLMSGVAGRLIGLLALARQIGDSRYVASALLSADRLLSQAQQRGNGLCWPSLTIANSPALLGLSHGASGIAVALLEAARVSGRDTYLRAAQGAFEYERGHYDARARNWPDLREESPGMPRSFATYWCHGAPGIALARIRALELGYEEEMRAEARTALGTTASFVRTALDGAQGNFSLCHGLAGNAEVLLAGSGLVAEPDAALPYEVADAGRRVYGTDFARWPCGTLEGSTAGLFLGLAGVGHFYLRLARPTTPSVLLMRPESAGTSGSHQAASDRRG